MNRPPVLFFIVCVLGELAAMNNFPMAVVSVTALIIGFVLLGKTRATASFI